MLVFNLNNMKMKKIFIYTSLIALVSIAGCKKELTQLPSNAVSSTVAFKTESDFTNAIRGAYGALRGSNYYGGQDGGSMAATPDVISDNVIINSQGRLSEQNFFIFSSTADNTWGLWYDAYSTILRANYILENINVLPDGAFKSNVKSEALALRALAHFDLLRTYAKRYVGASDADLGVPYVSSTDATLLPARETLKKSYDLVVADFASAETSINASNGVGRLNKAAVEALLGRVYLYMGNWQKCIDESTKAIADAPANNVLASASEFPSIWLDQSEKDVLFKVKFLDGDNTPIGVGYGQSSPKGVRVEYSPSYDLFTSYTSNDVRKSAYIGQTTFNNINFNYVKKYFGRAAGNANVVDYKVIRMGEVYLNRAEANYNLNNTLPALQDINTLEGNRYSGYMPQLLAGQPLYNEIMLQRRLELAFEGSRFFDLKRLGMSVARSSFGDRADGTGAAPSFTGIPVGSTKFQFAIPQYEINVNANIVQNPGY
jgi:hypothetical protein